MIHYYGLKSSSNKFVKMIIKGFKPKGNQAD